MASSHLSLLLIPLTTIFVIMSLVSPLAHGATSPQPQGLSSLSSPNTSRETAIEPFQIQCTTSLAWFVPVSANDCGEAYSKFLVDVDRYRTITFEFGDYGTPGTGRYRRRRTPRRYTFGDCTIAIALIKSFPRSYLPTPLPWTPGGSWPKNVPGDYRSFSSDLERVITFCDETALPAGWVRAGNDGDLGLFVFGTDSVVDMALGYLVPSVAAANHTLSGGTATA